MDYQVIYKRSTDDSITRAALSVARAPIPLAAVLGLTAMLAWGAPLRANTLELGQGMEHILVSSQSTCFTDTDVFPSPAERPNAEVEADCSNTDGTADIFLKGTGISKATAIFGQAGFEIIFKVPQVEGPQMRSFVPIHVFLPLSYAGRIRNDAIVGAIADFQISLTLSSFFGDHESVSVFTARHNGVGDCLTVPTSKIEIAEAVVKCALGVQQKIDAGTDVSLVAIVETGREYALKLSLEGIIQRGAGLGEILSIRSGLCEGKPNCYPPDEPESKHGLDWSAMRITVGTDFQENITELVEEVEELRRMLEQLREDFDRHSHIYRTGKGAGHNNTESESSTPNVSSGRRNKSGLDDR